MIEVHEEPKHIQREFGRTMESCTFCRTPTRYWDATKQHTVCPLCAEHHDPVELTPNRKPRT